MKDKNGKKSILFEITASFIIIIVVTCTVLGGFLFRTLGGYISQQSRFYQRQSVEKIGEDINGFVNHIDNTVNILIGLTVEEELYKGGGSRREAAGIYGYPAMKNVEEVLRHIRRNSTCISDIFMLFGDTYYTSSFFFSRERLEEKDWYRQFLQGDGKKVTIPMHAADYQTNYGKGPRVVSLLKKIISPEDARTVVGVILINIDYFALLEKVKSYPFDDRHTILLAEGDTLLCGYDHLALNEIEGELLAGIDVAALLEGEEKENYFFYDFPLSHNDWKVRGIVSRQEMNNRIYEGFRSFLLIALGTLLGAAVLSYFLAKRISRPIYGLVDITRRISEGDFSVQAKEGPNREMQALSEGFNHMLWRIRELMSNLKRKEHESANARFLALQAQINPHFLYNTLETIRSIAVRNHLDSVGEIVKSMAAIFRYSVDGSREEVRLADEVTHTEHYIRIQKNRYKNRLAVEFAIDASVLGEKIIKLVIQPLVENAIYHGLDKKKEGGRIFVEGRRRNDRIFIVIEDDGAGIEAEALFRLRRNLARGAGGSQNGRIGLQNVNARLLLYYGEESGLRIDSSPGEGTRVEFSIPADRKGGDDALQGDSFG